MAMENWNSELHSRLSIRLRMWSSTLSNCDWCSCDLIRVVCSMTKYEYIYWLPAAGRDFASPRSSVLLHSHNKRKPGLDLEHGHCDPSGASGPGAEGPIDHRSVQPAGTATRPVPHIHGHKWETMIAKFAISWSSISSYSPSWAVPALPGRCCRALRTCARHGYQPGSQLGAAEVRFCWRCQRYVLSLAYEGIRSTMPGPQQKGGFFVLLRGRKSNYFCSQY